MPYRKRKRTYRKRRRRRRFRRYKKVTASNNRGPLATRVKAIMNYSEQVSLDPGVAGIPTTLGWSCNGLYDPYISGTGHQPMGFDQLMLLYDHYVVIGAKFTAHCVNSDGNNSNSVALYVNDSTAPSALPTEILERRFVKYITLSSGEQNPKSISIKVNPNKFLSRSRPMSDPELKGSSSSNPTEQCFFMLSGFNIEGVNTSPINVIVRIQYSAIFFEPKQPAQS